jgi:HEPN domain-containing protein
MKLAHPVTWFRASAQRLEAAHLLFRHAMYVDATYLAGYVVECSIKGFIVTRVPVQRRTRFVQTQFRSARAHDFEYLWKIARQLGATVPVRIVERVRTSAWSTDLRYTSGLGDRDDASEVIEAGEEVLRWARSSA